MSDVVVLATTELTLKLNRSTNNSGKNNNNNNSNINHHQSSNESSKQASTLLQQQQQQKQRDQYNNDNNNNSNCNCNLETNRSHPWCDNTTPESSHSSHTSSLVLSSSSTSSQSSSFSFSSSSSSSSATSGHRSSSSSSFSSFRGRTKTTSPTISSSSSTKSIVVRQTDKLQSRPQQHCSCMLLNKNINPVLGSASSGSSGPSTTANHKCQCYIYHHQQPQNQSNVSSSYYNLIQTGQPNGKCIKLDTHIGPSLTHSNQTFAKHTLCNIATNTNANYRASKRSHRQLQQQQTHQTAPTTDNNHLAQHESHLVYQSQSSGNSLQHLDLPLPFSRNLLKRKNISEEESSGEGGVTTAGTGPRSNDYPNDELDDDLNFDYEPVLSKILDEKKLVSIMKQNTHDYVKLCIGKPLPSPVQVH